LERLKELGIAVFPGEQPEIKATDWTASMDELKIALAESGGSPLVSVFYAVSAEYRTGNKWGMTTVVFAVETVGGDGDERRRFWDSSQAEFKLPIRLGPGPGPYLIDFIGFFGILMVGERGFEPPAPTSRTWCDRGRTQAFCGKPLILHQKRPVNRPRTSENVIPMFSQVRLGVSIMRINL